MGRVARISFNAEHESILGGLRRSELEKRETALNFGQLAALTAYLLWGFIPLFWKQLTHVDPYELVLSPSHLVVCHSWAGNVPVRR